MSPRQQQHRGGRHGDNGRHSDNGAGNNGVIINIGEVEGGSLTFNFNKKDGNNRRQGPHSTNVRGGRGRRGGGSGGRQPTAPSQASHLTPPSAPAAKLPPPPPPPPPPPGLHRVPTIPTTITPPPFIIAPGLQQSKHAPKHYPSGNAFPKNTSTRNSNYLPPYVSSANNSRKTSPHHPPPVTPAGGLAGKGTVFTNSQ